jgi:hypothetical protein
MAGMKGSRKTRRGERGSELIELAIVLPIVLLCFACDCRFRVSVPEIRDHYQRGARRRPAGFSSELHGRRRPGPHRQLYGC